MVSNNVYTYYTIYKIFCNDKSITDFYIGKTNNLATRKRQHKASCNREKAHGYNSCVYKFIRDNGGWDNWSFETIDWLPDTTNTDALIVLKDFITELTNKSP